MADAKLILPPCDFHDDEEFLTWLEIVRLTMIKADDEMSENSAYTYAKLRRYAMQEGLSLWAATRTARAVSLPMARAAESFGNVAGYMRTTARRFEALIEATERPRNRSAVDFKVKSRGR